MVVGTVIIKIHTPWVHSLKEKRMVVKSLCAKVHNKFNASIAEIDEQDIHQIIVLGFACVTTDTAHADSIKDKIINFIESNTEGSIVSIEQQ
ncbi:MAG TPA: DUF503 domain-containing protein [Mobilitalea sp.]|nr:DUF503 domain-containing protein [Mobilitalea sp.]